MTSINSRHSAFFLIWLLAIGTSSLFLPSLAGDTITPTQPLRDGESLVSSGGIFELGFFIPGAGNSSKYLGIWYAKINPQTYVWVANRDKPIEGGLGGVLSINGSGNLELAADPADGTVFWTSAWGGEKASGATALLLDTGNLELIAPDGRVVWQSFDHPTDTLLPGMKLGVDLRTGLTRQLISWRAVDDPSPGNFSYSVSIHGVPQTFLRRRWDSAPLLRSGQWFGSPFSLGGDPTSDTFITFQFVANADEVYYSYRLGNPKILMRLVVVPAEGMLERLVWQDRTRRWDTYWSLPKDCDNYNACGSFGMCNSDSPFCKCLPGFESAAAPERGSLRDRSNHCVRRTKLGCGGDGFKKVAALKLPDTSNATLDLGMSTDLCAQACLGNCTCVAYATANSTSRSGCIMWTGELVDIKEFSSGGEELYLRVAESESDSASDAPGRRKTKHSVAVITIACVAAVVGVLLGAVAISMIVRRKHSRNNGSTGTTKVMDSCEDNREQDVQLPFFTFERIAAATDNFSDQNTLGKGGFGPVYRGRLECGQEIAVKRLSQVSKQGLDQFKTEVMLIARLQHRNLVRLLGCCIDRDERMLVYEYMPNKSLNSFIFDTEKSRLLDWRQRLDIISGIARGMLYLHQDSRLRIIHRDLKAGNVLLDVDMNPKISDFGTARILEGNRIKENTATVVGTYGYMAPEYVLDGVFSMKSDVFSFGVLVLEILSGKKNRGFCLQYCDDNLTLLGYAWKLWSEGNSEKLLDESLDSAESPQDMLRCIQIALLCLQERPEDRPEMSNVVFMLGSQCLALLPRPNKPGFASTSAAVAVTGTSSSEIEWTRAGAAGEGESYTVGGVTLTVLDGR